MQRQIPLEDSKKNNIKVTIFESNLSRFILENTHLYKDIYIKLLNAVEVFIKKNRTDMRSGMALSNIFYRLNETYSKSSSFDELRNNFNLVSADTFLKMCADTLLKFQRTDSIAKEKPAVTLAEQAQYSLFSNPAGGMSKLSEHIRCEQLYSEKNRGAISVKTNKSSRNLGIVEDEFTPEDLINYFIKPSECARFGYRPSFKSYVANWLHDRNLPVISGTSGTTEMIFSRIFPLASLSREEKQLVLCAQAASAVALGHHSFFECMLAADRYGYKLKETETLLDFYMQCIPNTICTDPGFKEFLHSKDAAVLLANMPLLRSATIQELQISAYKQS